MYPIDQVLPYFGGTGIYAFILMFSLFFSGLVCGVSVGERDNNSIYGWFFFFVYIILGLVLSFLAYHAIVYISNG